MHGLRKLTGLAVALLCLMLAGQVAHSQQTKPSGPGPGKEEKGKRGPIDDDDVVVRPKGKGTIKGGGMPGIAPYGFNWFQHDQPLRKGKAMEFRCDLYYQLDKLQVRSTLADPPADADAVHFSLEGFEFEVIKTKNGKYVWSIPDYPMACKKNQCTAGGVPPKHMEAQAKDGTIEARLANSGAWVPVEEVVMHGKECN